MDKCLGKPLYKSQIGILHYLVSNSYSLIFQFAFIVQNEGSSINISQNLISQGEFFPLQNSKQGFFFENSKRACSFITLAGQSSIRIILLDIAQKMNS